MGQTPGSDSPLVIVTEGYDDSSGFFRQEWHCEIPAPGSRYQVIRCKWDRDDEGQSVRRIFEVKLA
jgi:hypothetical protein